MKICGLIVEYNPMHQGHIHHIKEARRLTQCDVLVVIMTSYFSQRALPSLISPYEKTRLALEEGVDLVLELPCVYGSQSADRFAKFAIQSLSVLKIDTLCFGSETNDISHLEQWAQDLDRSEVDPKKSWMQNLGYDLKPNDILGIQYVRYCRRYGIEPICIARDPRFKSATQTRTDYFEKHSQEMNSAYFIPQQRWEAYYPYLRLFLLLSDPKTLSSFLLVTEGIENRLIKAAKSSPDWQTFLHRAISKTYTKARIQRTCLFILLQIKKEELLEHDSFFYGIVLGFDQTGRRYLSSLDSKRVLTRFKDWPPFLKQVHLKAKTLYQSVMPDSLKEGILYVENDSEH